MTDIAGFELDFISLAPAIFASLLSLYNWYQLNKAADIFPNEIINYGLIASEYNGGFQLCIPLIFHNEGSKRGMITSIRLGFMIEEKVKYIDILGKAKLNEIDINLATNLDWDKFEREGYRMIQPTYPIVVEGQESANVTLIAQAQFSENVIPINVKSKYVIEVRFGANKTNIKEFPFFLSQENSEIDNRLMWFEPISN